MSTDLRYICQSLLANRSNVVQYDCIIDQFISSVQLDAVLLASFAQDPSFPTFVQCLLFLVNRAQIPAPSEGKIPKRIETVIQFLTQIAYQNPEIAHIIAANIAADSFFTTLFKRPTVDMENFSANPSRYLPFFKLITVLACESDLFLSCTEAMSYYFTICMGLFEVPEVSKWAVASLVALVKNSPTACSYVRASPSFAKLKTTLAGQLSSDDPCVVIGSLCALVLLFPAAITPETSVRAAMDALEPLESFAPSIYMISWILLELNESCPLADEDIARLIQCAMKGGVRAYVLYNLMIDMSSQHLMMLDAMQGMNCLFTLIDSLLDSEEGFVAVAGCAFLFTIFHDETEFVLSDDMVDPFVKALHLVLAMRKHTQTDRREAGVLLLRFMIRSKESISYVIRIIQDHEQPLFLDFQRQIELNNAYLALEYFLFMYESSRFLSHWKQKLMALVLESQFPALATFVLTESRNRYAIADALRASQILADGFQNIVTGPVSPMFESLVSGYLLLNKRRHDSQRKTKSESVKGQEELMSKISAVEVERDCCEKELASLKSWLDENSSSVVSEQEQNKSICGENRSLRRQLHQTSRKIRQMTNRIKELEDGNLSMVQQIDNLQRRSSGSSSAREPGIRTTTTSISQVEEKLKKAKEDQALLLEETKQLRITNEKDRKKIERLKQKLAALKRKSASMKKKNVQITKILEENQTTREILLDKRTGLQQDLSLITQENEQLAETEEENTRLRDSLQIELERVIHERDASAKKGESRSKTVSDLQERVTKLEDRHNDLHLLIKLIHKTTTPNQRLSSAIQAFMKS